MKLRRLYCTVDEFLYVAFDWQWAGQSWSQGTRIVLSAAPLVDNTVSIVDCRFEIVYIHVYSRLNISFLW